MKYIKQLKLGVVTLATVGMIAACGGGSSSGSGSSALAGVKGTTTCPAGLDLVLGSYFASERDRKRLASGVDTTYTEGDDGGDPDVLIITGDLGKTMEVKDSEGKATTIHLSVAYTDLPSDEGDEGDGTKVIMFGYVTQEGGKIQFYDSIPAFVPFLSSELVRSVDPHVVNGKIGGQRLSSIVLVLRT